jgi:hypothetical protein
MNIKREKGREKLRPGFSRQQWANIILFTAYGIGSSMPTPKNLNRFIDLAIGILRKASLLLTNFLDRTIFLF